MYPISSRFGRQRHAGLSIYLKSLRLRLKLQQISFDDLLLRLHQLIRIPIRAHQSPVQPVKAARLPGQPHEEMPAQLRVVHEICPIDSALAMTPRKHM